MDNISCSGFPSNIRLIGDDVERFRTDGSVECSSGVIPARLQYKISQYGAGAFVPRLPWRTPNDPQFDKLLSPTDDVRPGLWIQIIRVPDEIFGLFEPARSASTSATDDRLKQYTRSGECQEHIRRTVDYVRTLTWPELTKLERAGVFFKRPGLPTTTPRDSSELLGLHIDTVYVGVPLQQRKYSPRRICINLGLNDRCLLFLTLGVDQIQQILADNGIDYIEPTGQSTYDFRRAFMANFPHTPVIKVRIRPGEAYLAPTENMIHDGCTVGQRSFDVQFSVCGHFRPMVKSINPASRALLSERLRNTDVAMPLLNEIPSRSVTQPGCAGEARPTRGESAEEISAHA